MAEQTGPLPPWHSGTRLFDEPDARCELLLDGHDWVVSIALWEGYCYLNLADSDSLWGITQPYNGSDLVQFVAAQIEAGEVGRIWDFSYTTPDPTPVPISRWSNRPRYSAEKLHFRIVAMVRFDNSALVREWQNGPFLATPAFSKRPRIRANALKDGKINQAKLPSIWHAGRKLIGRQQIGHEVNGALYRVKPEDELSQEELFKWKKGSLPELTALLEALCICAYVDKPNLVSLQSHSFSWPLQRAHLSYYPFYHRPKTDLKPFLKLLWDEHHFDESNWIPEAGTHYLSVPKTRQHWKRPRGSASLVAVIPPVLSAHQKMEAALIIGNWFKDKISDEQLNELLQDNT